jgi:predicted PurR-regulated permease PerM
MPAEQRINSERKVDQAVEASIHIGLLILLAIACLSILAPFLALIAWGAIIAVAASPAERKLQRALRGRGVWSSAIVTLVILAFLILPLVLLMGTLVDGAQSVATHVKDGTLAIPPPPETIQKWPLIGAPLAKVWGMAATNLSAVLHNFAPQVKVVTQWLLSASAGLGLTVLQFALSIVIAGFLLASRKAAAAAMGALASRLFGENGPEFERLVESTIRSVTTGIFGVALIQAVLAALGFFFVGLPGAGLWAVLFLVAAILQVGALVLIPAVIYAFTAVTTTSAVIFLVWCILVALLDNVLKPILLGRGAAVPMVVVFLGAIGGFVGMGMIGLFVGAIVLSVGYKLFLAWLQQTPTVS